ncbi:MAG: pyruvate kinase [Chloroflexi bacterium]|nr:pyruvate kinase [Chloroflexota bacterium]
MNRRTKIVATIGPASQSEELIEKLILAGMNVARMNFSHGTHEQHAERIATIRRVSARLGVPIGILQDLQGPKIRVGNLPAPLQLAVGELVCLYAAEEAAPACTNQLIPVDFPELFDSVRVDDRLLLDDGRLAFVVLSVERHTLMAKVVVGGTLSSHKGINLPGVKIRVAGFTSKDEADLAFGLQQGVDAVAISFVRSADDVLKVRTAMKRLKVSNRTPLLIAKLEKPEVFKELDRVLEIVDGVMVARGDLGVEMPPETVPVMQKRIIQAANARARLVITATQMLESMIHNPLPTRAEASDVANAIFDGTDAVMLSAESASGEYPVEAVTMMGRIAVEAESHFKEWGTQYPLTSLGESDAASMSRAAFEIARDRDVAAIAVFTMQGRSAVLISKTHPSVPILAFTPDEFTYRRVAFQWGVVPHLVPFANTVEDMLQYVDTALLEGGKVQSGQQVVLVCGFPVGALRAPNMALLHTVGGDVPVRNDLDSN